MKKIYSKELSSFLKSHSIQVSNSIKEMMTIGCQLGYLTDEDILYMSTAGEHAAQRRMTTRRMEME